MESSKFWMLRKAWFAVKRRLGLERRTDEGERRPHGGGA
jgi:hypothetical protein